MISIVAANDKGIEPGEIGPDAIGLAPTGDEAMEVAQLYLERERVQTQLKRMARRVMEHHRKRGEPLPEAKEWKDLPRPIGSMKAEMVSNKVLKPGQHIEVHYDATVTIPEAALGQLLIEIHVTRVGSSSSSMKLGRTDQIRMRGSLSALMQSAGESKVLIILAARTIKDAEVRVLDAVEMPYFVAAAE